MIILTAAQAAKVRGISPTHPWAGLDPTPLKDGTYMLDEGVLSDLAHADVRSLLESCPKAKPAKANTYDSLTGSEAPAQAMAKQQADARALIAIKPDARVVRVADQKVAGLVDKIKRWFA